ncbi:MAG: alpha/beta hydrolase [Candidatus Saccharibacteria bacterium]|nr:alpha/beta hydrolase [Moraxellaceae bacterium]
MSLINVGIENSIHINLHYEDLGEGKPVVLIHGWPLSGASWEKQIAALLATGHRVITYDRRGFGRSTQPSTGYEYDTLAEDLHKILIRLDVYDATLVGFSMGGGEVARYLGKYGSEQRVTKVVFIDSVTPFLLKTADNPEGVDGEIFEGIKQGLVADRPAFLADFLKNFYNFDVLGGTKVSEQLIQYSWNVAVAASPKATLDCVTPWGTDFRHDLAGVEIPVLVIHGDADRIVPIEASALRMQSAVKHAVLVVIEGAPHGLIWTHAEQVNSALLKFLAE